MWHYSAVSWDESARRDLEAALDEVTDQLGELPRAEIVDQEDLDWSFESGVYVTVEVQSDNPLVLRLDASKGFWFRRASAERVVQIDPK